MRVLLFFLLFSFTMNSSAQVENNYNLVDEKMAIIPLSMTNSTTEIANYISQNFFTESEKIRAVFYWTASNISYDFEGMFDPFHLDSPEVKIEKTLKSKKGVCIHYSEVFNDIANRVGIKTYIIAGYSKQNGQIPNESHAWCASKIDGKWYIIDPTWGSGFIDNKKFTMKLNNAFFMVAPQKMIQTHMPYDYLWQFLNSPIKNQEFIEGIVSEENKISNFDFESEISKYENLSNEDKVTETAKRVERNGLLNQKIMEYYNLKNKEYTILIQNKNIQKLNKVTLKFNAVIGSLNEFISYSNSKFLPYKPTDEVLKTIEDIKEQFMQCKSEITTIGEVGKENTTNITKLKALILESIEKSQKIEAFTIDYLGKQKDRN